MKDYCKVRNVIVRATLRSYSKNELSVDSRAIKHTSLASSQTINLGSTRKITHHNVIQFTVVLRIFYKRIENINVLHGKSQNCTWHDTPFPHDALGGTAIATNPQPCRGRLSMRPWNNTGGGGGVQRLDQSRKSHWSGQFNKLMEFQNS